MTSSLGYGGRRYRPLVFTEFGVAMLSSVLKSNRAIQVNIAIMRSFGQMRLLTASNVELTKKLNSLESKYDQQFKVVFDAIRYLMWVNSAPRKSCGSKLKLSINNHYLSVAVATTPLRRSALVLLQALKPKCQI